TGATSLDLGQGRGAYKGSLLELDRPAQTGVEGVCPLVHVVSIESEPSLQPAGVARPQAAGKDARLAPRLEQRLPNLNGSPRGHEDLEAVLARIAGAGDQCLDAARPIAADGSVGKAEVRQSSQVQTCGQDC